MTICWEFISFSGGIWSTDAVIAELQRLVKVPEFAWQVEEKSPNKLTVLFPDQTSFDHLVNDVGGVRIKGTDFIMSFEAWNARVEIKPTRYLKAYWVRVEGVPYELRNYLSLCAVGSIAGAVLNVDMVSTRKGIIRIQVAAPNPTAIAGTVEIVVGLAVYDITYVVEDDMQVDSTSTPPPNSNNDESADKGNPEKSGTNSLQQQQLSSLRGQHNSTTTSSVVQQSTPAVRHATDNQSLPVCISAESVGQQFANTVQNEHMLHVCTRLRTELFPEVASDGEDVLQSPGKAGKVLDDKISRMDMQMVPDNQAVCPVHAPGTDAEVLDTMMENHVSTDVISSSSMVFATPPASTQSTPRRSARTNTPDAQGRIPADEDTMLKAKRQAALRNLEDPKGDLHMLLLVTVLATATERLRHGASGASLLCIGKGGLGDIL